MYRIIASIALCVLLSIQSFAQQGQTVRGSVFDTDSGVLLPGVTVILITHGSEPMMVASDMAGAFSFANVKPGRVSVKSSYVGYETYVQENILVTTGKEVVLEVRLMESVTMLTNAVIEAERNRSEALNDMAVLSARTVSVEETKRYAGSIDDPARMVSTFAGVNSDAQGNNDIIVRGNSPRGILWRLEGMEIPNPNHFANEGSTGGPINALNSAMLANSDFLTSAFSADYGNALSGVFDMNLRKGNNSQREYSASVSVLGTDLTVEGPFQKGGGNSYLANYRYSTLSLIDQLGILDFGGVPKYQDACFNLNFKINANQKVSMYGLGGLSAITTTTEKEEDDKVIEKYVGSADLGVLGVNHTWLIGEKTIFENQVAWSATRNKQRNEILNEENDFFDNYRGQITQRNLRFASTVNYKFNAKNKVVVGLILTERTYNYDVESFNFDTNIMTTEIETKGGSGMTQGFITYRHRFTESLSLVSGIHYLRFLLNDRDAIEPRMSLKYTLPNGSELFAGAGMHSKVEALSVYLASVEHQGEVSDFNQKLGLSKAAHFVAGYSFKVGPLVNFKVESYYQELFNIPQAEDENIDWTMLNSTDFFPTYKLNNQGKGKNYGLELTCERYFNKGWYGMSTVSLYRSLYLNNLANWKPSRFDGKYVYNVLGGKEFPVGKPEKMRTMFINTKLAMIGGGMYTPIDLAASQEDGVTVYESVPYSTRMENVFKWDLSFGIRRNKQNRSTEWKFDIQNITNNQAILGEYYDPASGKVDYATQLPLLPVISYRVNF
ncbi:MAG: TonB-dependent receptor plug domain-containing protein [Cryomorphaceae bacterium]|nr:TonB-dependent receptor plug domain-containing protein [Cryomorphaceae bacterium]